VDCGIGVLGLGWRVDGSKENSGFEN